VENLLTEIEILKDIRHPHIVQLKDFQVGAWDGTPSKESWRRDTVFRLPLYL
jgi:serine/threonine protein kinase